MLYLGIPFKLFPLNTFIFEKEQSMIKFTQLISKVTNKIAYCNILVKLTRTQYLHVTAASSTSQKERGKLKPFWSDMFVK